MILLKEIIKIIDSLLNRTKKNIELNINENLTTQLVCLKHIPTELIQYKLNLIELNNFINLPNLGKLGKNN